MTNSGSNTLTVIDTTAAPAVAFTTATGAIPDAIALSPDQQTVVVSNEGDNTVTIFRVDQAPAGTVPGAGVRALTRLPLATRPSGSRPPAVMLAAPPWKVTLAATHGPLGLVPEVVR